MLLLAILLSSAGAGLAITNVESDESAAVAQNGAVSATDDQLGTVAGRTAGDGTLSSSSGGSGEAAADVQAARQQGTGGNAELAFFGYAALPLLIGGLALLTGGLVVCHRADAADWRR